MKPISSAARTGVRAMRSATPVTSSATAAAVSEPGTTSTSRISTGGLKKCIPQTRSGRSTSAAIAVTDSEDVFVARIAPGPQAAASRREDLAFQLERLRRGLDHEVAAGQVLEPGRGDQACRGRLRLLRRPAAPIGALQQAGAHAALAGGERLAVGIVKERLEAAEAGELSDPRAHRAGPGDPDSFDPHSSGLGSPSR